MQSDENKNRQVERFSSQSDASRDKDVSALCGATRKKSLVCCADGQKSDDEKSALLTDIVLRKAFEGDGSEEQVLKLQRSLNCLVQALLHRGNYIKAALEAEGLKQSVSDPCMIIDDGMVVLTYRYVNNVHFFGKDGS